MLWKGSSCPQSREGRRSGEIWKIAGKRIPGGTGQERSKETHDLAVRMLFGGTHGTPVNRWISVRDHDKSPAAPDLQRVCSIFV